MTVLQIIQEVQRRLRLPESAALTDAHANLLLSFINTVQRDFMLESVVWDECKVYGSFNTMAGTAIYTISVSGQEIDVVRNLQIGTSEPLARLDDADFREYKRANTGTGQGQPLAYRIYGRIGGDMIVELCPSPNSVYQVDYEVLKKPPRLATQNETPLLDADTIIAGVLMLAKKEQGDDFQQEFAAFQMKLGLQSETQGESNWGDVEAV